MSGTDDKTVKEHRKEVLVPMFDYINGSESFYVVGGPSVGKTRLLDFLMREDVQKHYLKEKDSGEVWLVRVDMNRLSIRNEPWAFYELLLNSTVLELSYHKAFAERREEFWDMNTRVMESQDLLLALRHFELVVKFVVSAIQYFTLLSSR